MRTAAVVNKRSDPYDIDITRQGIDHGFWGNPFHIGFEYHGVKADREMVLDLYRDWLYQHPEGRKRRYRLGELRGKKLGCVCSPAACHGDILETEVNALPEAIDQFSGDNRYLSNFYEYAPGIHVEGEYQANKPARQADVAQFYKPTGGFKDPYECKKLGYAVVLRHGWETDKLDVMAELVMNKFSTTPELADRLLLTCDAELIEGNSWCDEFWGMCGRGVKCRKGKHGGTTGKNYLGQILMAVRSDLLRAVMGA